MFELRGKYSGYDPLQTDEESLFPSPKQKPFVSRNALAASSLILAVVGSVILLKDTKIPAWIGGSSAFDAKTAPKQMSKEINFSFKKSGYDPLPYFDTNYDRLTTYPFLNNYVSVIEPYSSMLFHMYEKSEYDVHYSVCNDSGSCQKGIWNAKDETSDAVKFECSPYDKLTVTAKMYDANDQVLHSVSGSALCLYVRREVRSLSEDELTRFIGVSAMLNQIKDKDGLEKYGPNYMSSSTLVKYHHFNAVQQNADHIHEGNGFVIQHVKLTNLFENSLQSVDPSLTLPYWDFTIDSKSGLTMDKASIFTEKMYGSNYEATTVTDGWTYKNDLILNGRIKDGPWKDLKVEMNPYEGDEYNFGFGYMRAPWNLNPSPYLSRYPLIETTAKIGEFYMPTCTDHYEALKYDDRMDFYLESSFDPHGTLHILEGGFYGCDLLQPLVDAGYITDYNSVCYYWVFTLKELYRAGDISPNKDCMIKENMQDTFCGYSCPNDGAGVYSKVKSMVGIGLDTTKEGIEDAFKDFVCGGDGGRIFPGDHLESASPADPSFWVIHPTLERLLHAKLLAGGFMTSNEWPTNSKKDYVCAKTSCYGHYQDDQMYDGLAGSTTSFFGPTNREVESATDARAADYSMPYIYDNFEWDHCDEDFDGLLVNLFNDMQEYITEEETAAAGGNTRRRASTRRVPRPEAQVKVRAEKAKVVEENMKKM